VAHITLVNAVLPSSVNVPPQGILYLTAALEAAGFTVEIRDYQLCRDPEPWTPEALARFVRGSAPIVGFSCMSYILPLICRASALIKAERPDVRIVLGGIGPAGAGAPLLDYCPDIDATVIGEGERTIVDLVERWIGPRPETAAAAGVNGLHLRTGGKVITTLARERVRSMTHLDPPAYRRVDFSQYRLVDSQFARGCPFECSFCDIAPYWNRRNVHRPMEHYLDELEWLVRDLGADDVFIIDDTFVLSRKMVTAFCEGILARGLDFEWGCYARVDLIDAELLDLMAEAGCRKVFFGIETGSDRVLQAVDKATTVDQCGRTVKLALERLSFVTTSFVWGFPDETLEELKDTAFFLLYLAALGASPQLNLALPYALSPLYKQYRDRIVFDPDKSSQLQFFEGDRSWLCDMIAERPDLFSVFYHFPTPDLQRKWDYLDRIGLSPHDLQRAYDHPLTEAPAAPGPAELAPAAVPERRLAL
jgi:anaerobic magnesium-protoporphyrin IX monomethyl ester cyclase